MDQKPAFVKKDHDCYASICGRAIWCHKSRVNHIFTQINDHIFMDDIYEKQAMYILYSIYGLDTSDMIRSLELIDVLHITKYFFYCGDIMTPYITNLIEYYRTQLPSKKAKEILAKGIYERIFHF